MLSVLLIGPLGLVGVALGTAIPNVLFAIVRADPHVPRARRRAGQLREVRRPARRARRPADPGAAVVVQVRDFNVDSLTGLVAAGSADGAAVCGDVGVLRLS